ncbi:exosome complex exonuclease [Theileria orientalis strain Shintoku]|uniref:Exosome complex exonuclease n=1 Tax=Theileria orientalis strain Shintoku TaxID=869250 RepID=J4CCH4_THEOR|nr:exosome complex exonuclease [Theileria orientalis strain Shintoku]PVC53313.1 exosome complex exonuclease [Theileria orientalis]BAM39397.1 exosome complex exonuclease [Theileria orientalis strain Shintoku]|eukprot:XP_009689698.1 exosome complex exonuclease [Theileria orientalis strain Shintoku]
MPKFSRIDSRSNHSLRPFYFQLNPLKSGPSCKVVVGNIKNEDGILTGIGGRTSVVALLMFSHEPRSKNTIGSFHKPYMEVFVRPQSGPIRSSIRAMEAVLVKVMQRVVKGDRLGKVNLSLRLQIIEDSGGLLSVCLNALVICLSLSGIEMLQVPFAVSVGICRTGEEEDRQERVILDPTDYESRSYCETSLTMLCDPDTGNVSLITIDSGSGSYGNSLKLIKNLARNAAVEFSGTFNKLRKESLSSYYTSAEAKQ